MIYWFTGQPSAGKTTLGTKLHRFLKTEKRNWRRDVFHLDGDNLRELTVNKDYTDKGRETNIRNAQMIAEYLHNNGCDVVVSLVAPYRWLREEFKARHNVNEIYLHTTEIRGREHYFAEDYESPEEDFLDIDTTNIPIDTCISKVMEEFVK